MVVMQELALTQEQIARLDDDIYDLVKCHRWYAQWNPGTQSFYAQRNIATGRPYPRHQRHVYLHNVVWETFNGPVPPGVTIDHIDRDSLNDLIENLRLATRAQQSQNHKILRSNSSGYRGVSWKAANRKYRAYISPPNAKPLHLGYFATPEEAALAYNEAALVYHGEFAQLNEVAL